MADVVKPTDTSETNPRANGEPATVNPDTLRLFSRSPHPYHRRQQELQPGSQDVVSTSSSSLATPPALTPPCEAQKTGTPPENAWTCRKTVSRATSDSGSEADDEGYNIVRALPAPPLRPRKGLRDTRGGSSDGVSSPLLTPTQVDEDEARLRRQYFKSGKHASREPSPSDEEAITARKKFIKRRRAELLRRTTETGLLGAIGATVVGRSMTVDSSCWRRELISFSSVLPILCGVYALRLLVGVRSKPFLQRIHIPAAFDPATLIYPVFLPILTVLSLPSGLERVLLPNLILSLSALPSRLIPFGSNLCGYSGVHWIIAISPLIVSENTEWASKLFPPEPYKLKLAPPVGQHPEFLVSLYALHHALLPPLHYLTTTSLLPAELQLLSVGLINILLFAGSPQITILSILLWVGGIGLFVFCGPVLRWGVALARVPRWRLRRASHILRARQNFIEALTERLGSRKQNHSRQSSPLADSDEDDQLQPTISGTIKESLKLDILNLSKSLALAGREERPQSAVDPPPRDVFNNVSSPNGARLNTRKRRFTLPTLDAARQRISSHERHRHSRSSSTNYFLSLTTAQATVRRWVYAGYVYIAIAALILGPIRYLVSTRALNGEEPFGWAIGYLFGGLSFVRDVILDLSLNWWIPLPPPSEGATAARAAGLSIEHLRQAVLGPANTRLLLMAFYVTIISLGLLAVLTLTIVEVDTRRKVFHGIMVVMFLPTTFIDPCFIALALALTLSIFLLLDLLRASQLPPLSKPLARFLTPYVDGRDLRGPVVISHIFLLIGCAIPLWLALAALPRSPSPSSSTSASSPPNTNTTTPTIASSTADATLKRDPWRGWDVASRDVSMLAGVVCVGMGDAAASLVGRRFGRRKWPWAGGKSLEGSAAFACAVTAGLVAAKAWLKFGGWEDGGEGGEGGGYGGGALEVLLGMGKGVWGFLGRAGVAACGAALMEAVLTGGNDNVVVPVVLWLLVRGLEL